MEYKFKPYKYEEPLRGHLNLGGTAPNGGRIDVTSKYFEKNGKPFIGVMGEYHFSRADADTWAEELAKMKAGGVTIVSTYVIWIYHEEIEGEYDFTGDRDLRAFMNICRKVGLDVIIRIGPWCHGEVRNGGFPDWLLKKPFALRENNAEYLALVKKWYSKIAEQVEGLMFKDGGNIIGVQLENEYCHNAEHLAALKEIAKNAGLDAPIYTVTGWNSAAGAKIPVDEVVPVFGGYCDAPWAQGLDALPPSPHYFFNQMRNDSAIGADLATVRTDGDWRLPYERYPFATCELGGGLESTHHRRYIINGMDIYAVSLIKLACGNNLIGYYMYHGNTNKIGKLSTLQESAATGYPNDYPILSYDFQAPISEFGEIREQYRLLNMLHMFVSSFGDIIAPMAAVDAAQSVTLGDNKSLRYGMRTDGKSGFVFVNHYQRRSKLEDLRDVVIDTGFVKFPPIDICGETAFFMPFNMDINGYNLKYATAQPLCKVGDAYFFAEIPGIKARYDIDAAAMRHIVTLTWDEARYLRLLDGELFLGDNCDLYIGEGASVMSAEDKPYSFGYWNGAEFEKISVALPYSEPTLEISDCAEPSFKKPYAYELNIGGGRKVTWKKLTVHGVQGFIELDFMSDVMQLYIDGALTADTYYKGIPWRLPAAMLNGRECYLTYSQARNDFYKEF
ncbi:MAG: beta-galactosidase [Firmicutes bacterium]|nr:beta-galactosidase [Bacillota bacterium]